MVSYMLRIRLGTTLCLATAFAVLGWANVALGDDPVVVRVEEDWELVIGSTDTNSVAPQVTAVISPLCNVKSWYATFEVNARSLPTFSPGGLQLQTWQGGNSTSEKKFPGGGVLAQAGESICWTQSMELSDGTLTYEVTDGQSSTWGAFGGQGHLKGSVSTSLSNLNHYDPDVSVSNSGVGYAKNLVQSLTIKRVRVFLSSGAEVEDATERVVHTAEQ